MVALQIWCGIWNIIMVLVGGRFCTRFVDCMIFIYLFFLDMDLLVYRFSHSCIFVSISITRIPVLAFSCQSSGSVFRTCLIQLDVCPASGSCWETSVLHIFPATS